MLQQGRTGPKVQAHVSTIWNLYGRPEANDDANNNGTSTKGNSKNRAKGRSRPPTENGKGQSSNSQEAVRSLSRGMFANISDAPARCGPDSGALSSSSGLFSCSANIVANTSDYNCNLDAYMVANTSDHNCNQDSTPLQARTLIAPSRVTLSGTWHQAGDNFESRQPCTAKSGDHDAELFDSNGDLIIDASESVLIFKPLAPIRFE